MHVLLCVLHLDIALKKVLTLIWIPKKIEFELAPETTYLCRLNNLNSYCMF